MAYLTSEAVKLHQTLPKQPVVSSRMYWTIGEGSKLWRTVIENLLAHGYRERGLDRQEYGLNEQSVGEEREILLKGRRNLTPETSKLGKEPMYGHNSSGHA